mgnify:CR=1 FL=1
MEVKNKIINDNAALQMNALKPAAYRQSDIRHSTGQTHHDPSTSSGQIRRNDPIGTENAINIENVINTLRDSLKNALLSIERHMNRGISLEVESELGSIIVKIIDRESGEVVRQVPFEDAVEISKHLKAQLEETIKRHGGLFIDMEV